MSEVDKLKMEVEGARFEVMQSDKEISSIRQALRTLATATGKSFTGEGTDSDDENSLKISATKITGLPDEAKPTIKIQLSSPIESKNITELSDPLDPSKGSVDFKGVETSVATLSVQVTDAGIPLGSSATYDVSPLCDIDVLGGVFKKVTDLDVAIVPDDDVNNYNELNVQEKEQEQSQTVEETATDDKVSEEIVDGDQADADTETDGTGEDDFQDAKSEVESIPTEEQEGNVDSEDKEENVVENVSEESVEKDKDDSIPGEEKAEKSLPIEEKAEDVTPVEEKAEDVTPVEEKAEDVTPVEEKVEDFIPVEEKAQDVTPVEEKTEESSSIEEKAEDAAPMKDEADNEDVKIVEETPSSEEKEDEKGSSDAPVGETLPPKETTTKSDPADSKPSSTSALLPTCVISFRVEFNPSTKNQKDELYDLLNKASKRKAMAVDKLRRSAAALNRKSAASGADAITPSSSKQVSTVKAGFLNKKSPKKEPMFLIRWYEKTLGPNSMVRKVYPIAKNYILFFGGVALMHFQGHQLALPAPV